MTAAVQSEERTTTAQAKKQYIAEIANLRAKLSNALGEVAMLEATAQEAASEQSRKERQHDELTQQRKAAAAQKHANKAAREATAAQHLADGEVALTEADLDACVAGVGRFGTAPECKRRLLNMFLRVKQRWPSWPSDPAVKPFSKTDTQTFLGKTIPKIQER